MMGAVDPASGGYSGGDGNPKGVVRPALTDVDIEARFWLMDRAAEAGLAPTIDAIGTTIARGNGGSSKQQHRQRLLLGSHSDTQATGGWLDGALGVVYALEAARAIQEAGGPAVVDVVNFQDEEGRFGSLVGSTAYVILSVILVVDISRLAVLSSVERVGWVHSVHCRCC
jgi:N-carbamoyl-L-amino-acid hydrolase